MPIFDNRIVSRGFYNANIKGPQGEPGPTGSQGLTGLGFNGTTGSQGITGLRGMTGMGLPGGTGISGATGIQGIPGPQGETGVGSGGGGTQGATGIQGEPGDPGIDGAMGVTGLRGEPGLEGYPGSQGETGLSVYPGIATLTSQVSIANTNAETTIITSTLPTNSLVAGSQFRFTFYGTHQNQNTSGTLTFKMYIGANAGQTIVLASGSTRAQTYMEFYGLATIRTTGATGTYINSGMYEIHTSVTASTKAYQGGNSTSIVDTTASSPIVKITAQWQTTSATNILLIQNASIERVA